MARFMIEITHPDPMVTPARAQHALERRGSHFVTRAEHGCCDGVPRSWLVVDVANRADAQRIVPPEFRRDARVVQLQHYAQQRVFGKGMLRTAG